MRGLITISLKLRTEIERSHLPLVWLVVARIYPWALRDPIGGSCLSLVDCFYKKPVAELVSQTEAASRRLKHLRSTTYIKKKKSRNFQCCRIITSEVDDADWPFLIVQKFYKLKVLKCTVYTFFSPNDEQVIFNIQGPRLTLFWRVGWIY